MKYGEEYCIIVKNGKKGLVRGGEIVIKPIYDDITHLDGDDYIIVKNGKKGLFYWYKIVAKPIYDDIEINSQFYILKKNGKKRSKKIKR